MLNLPKDTTSKSIGGITDLVVWAPIRDEFIHAFENITYETRLKLTAEALHKVRVSAREHELNAPFPDTAERILSLLNFRIGVLDDSLFQLEKDKEDAKSPRSKRNRNLKPRRYMYLVATFDGPWEPYMRLIWDPLGPFLDLLLCNCVPYSAKEPDGYKLAQETSFEDYAEWVRKHQLDASIFYSTTGLTLRDQVYLTKLEQLQRTLDPCKPVSASDPTTGDVAIATMTHDLPETLAEGVRNTKLSDTIRLGFEALTVLYRLADYYPPYLPRGKVPGDGRLLLRAAYDLLGGLTETFNKLQTADPATYNLLSTVYAEPLAWFDTASGKPASSAGDRHIDRHEIQKGILSPYDRPGMPVAQGALMFMQIRCPARAREFIRKIAIDWEGSAMPPGDDHIFHNIGFTFEGLRSLRLAEEELVAFPKEFREGSANRAPLIGDVRENHPREWRLPSRNWPRIPTPDVPLNPPIDLSEIDFVIQLRMANPTGFIGEEFDDYGEGAWAVFQQLKLLYPHGPPDAIDLFAETSALPDSSLPGTPIEREIGRLAFLADYYGAALLGTESMARPDDKAAPPGPNPAVFDHFGYRDGLSQPTVDESLSIAYHNDVPPGDLLCGYRNSLTDADWETSEVAGRRYTDNGSFLVVRKMSQDVKAFEDFLTKAQGENPDLTREEIAGLLMGRSRQGAPLAAPTTINDFTYANDPKGLACPFPAHIRRANPRDSFQGRPTPRILRRGMTYGKRYPSDERRGSMFMAYVASIAEQYEVVQRWINGGNSTRVESAQNDPIVGISPDSGPRTMRFMAKGSVRRLKIDKPFVGLEYMLYLFVPSKTALRRLADPATLSIPGEFGKPGPGQDIIDLLADLDSINRGAAQYEWKRVLEDFSNKDPAEMRKGPDVWAAIRDLGGAFPLEDGVAIVTPTMRAKRAPTPDVDTRKKKSERVILVGSWDLIQEVLIDSDLYSVKVQQDRTTNSFGEIFVAMDPGKIYHRESAKTNEAIWKYSHYSPELFFTDAYEVTRQRLDLMRKTSNALRAHSFKLELRRELFMPVLGELCVRWFDIPDIEIDEPDPETNEKKPQYIELGGWGWSAVDQSGTNDPSIGMRKPRCPGDFMAPSRYCFYPRPTKTTEFFGKEHGKALKAAALKIVRKKRVDKNVHGRISTDMYRDIGDDTLLARNLIGIMEGMLPPTDGILRGIIYDWLEQNSIWRHQGALHRETQRQRATYTQAVAALEGAVKEAMCKRPSPDLIYRTATTSGELGGVSFEENDTIVLGLVSAMQESLATGTTLDISPVFGGNRCKAQQPAGEPVHACPAQDMVMASIYGILAALLDSGRIVAQPASLIIQINEFPPPPPAP